jgi:ribosomal protein S18 acetylase RimI-like enzyme
LHRRVAIVLRQATAEDLVPVLDLWSRAGLPPGATDDEAALGALLSFDPGALLVAEVDGDLAGALIAGWDGWRGGMYRLAVAPERRRRGVGRRLVAAGEERLRGLGARRVAAPLEAGDPGAIAFWRAVGYEEEAGQARFVRALQPPRS